MIGSVVRAERAAWVDTSEEGPQLGLGPTPAWLGAAGKLCLLTGLYIEDVHNLDGSGIVSHVYTLLYISVSLYLTCVYRVIPNNILLLLLFGKYSILQS